MDDEKPTSQQDEPIVLTTREVAFAELADLNSPDLEGGEGPKSSTGGAADADGSGAVVAPPVVVVLVVHNAGEWFAETLESLGRQTYSNLSILVIDADSDIDPTPQVAKVLPGAYVRRLEHNIGFGPTLNEILELVSGATFFCLCHDDVALDDDCIQRLVEEAFRSNAGIVGPKIVDWDDPESLLHVGFTVDPSGGRATYAERGELDQGQHDAVRDVFAVPGCCTLVRSDLFAHLGGFDPDLDLLGEDLDLCWRSHLVGGRVVVAPAARVRHRERLDERIDEDRLIRADAAHRVRTTLTNYRAGRLVFLIPQMLVTSFIEALIEVSIGRRDHARALLAAWTSNLRALPSIRRSRKQVHRIREQNDRTIRRLQAHTWARLDGLVQAHRRSRALLDAADETPHSAGLDKARSLVPLGVIAVVALVVLGTRDLFFGPLPPIGSFLDPPRRLADVWHLVFTSWNPVGLGSNRSPAAGLTSIAAAGTAVAGGLGFLRRVSILLPVAIGLFGMWRSTRAFGSRRAQLVSLVFYAAVPVAWNSFAQGRWSGLVIYAVAPWLFHWCATIGGDAPFGGTGEAGRGLRRWWSRALGLGLLLAVVGSVAPVVAGVLGIIVVGILLGSLLTWRFGGSGRLLVSSLVGVAVAAGLLMPWTIDGPGSSLASFAGMGSASHGWLGMAEIVRFQSGPFGAGPLGLGLLVAAGIALLIGRSWRFVWAVRGWSVTLVSWGVLWSGQQRWFDLVVPTPEVLLAPAACGLAVSAACGMAAIEKDLAGYRFGWAQAASVVAGIGLVIGVLPTVGNAASDGRWKMSPVGLDQALGFLSARQANNPFKVLWIGDPDVIPLAGWNHEGRMTVAVSNEAMPTMAELWAPGSPGGSSAILRTIDLATSGQTTRVGRVFADMGIRYIVLPRQIAPLPYRTVAHRPPAGVLSAFDDQLDLARVQANDAVVVYENMAWMPGCTLWPRGTEPGESVADALDAVGGRSVLAGDRAACSGSGSVSSAGVLATHHAFDPGWKATIGGHAAKPVELWGWEQGFVLPTGGTVQTSYDGGGSRIWLRVVVGVGWLLVLVGWVAGRRRTGGAALSDSGAHLDADEGTFVRVGSTKDPTGELAVRGIDVGRAEQGDDAEGES